VAASELTVGFDRFVILWEFIDKLLEGAVIELSVVLFR
jgi:hypothetical protein